MYRFDKKSARIFRRDVRETYDTADYVANPSDMSSFQKRKTIVKLALTCHIADLKKSKNAVREKVCNVIPNLGSVYRKIKLPSFVSNRFCNFNRT